MTKTIEVSDETFEKIKDQLSPSSAKSFREIVTMDELIGSKVFIRTVTYHSVGRIVKTIAGKFFVLEDASWVGNSGRFMQAIKNGELSEVEPVGDMILNAESIVDMFPWVHPLPTKQK